MDEKGELQSDEFRPKQNEHEGEISPIMPKGMSAQLVMTHIDEHEGGRLEQAEHFVQDEVEE
eukprot:5584333-Alexandrium_andersonii.AAC.1